MPRSDGNQHKLSILAVSAANLAGASAGGAPSFTAVLNVDQRRSPGRCGHLRRSSPFPCIWRQRATLAPGSRRADRLWHTAPAAFVSEAPDLAAASASDVRAGGGGGRKLVQLLLLLYVQAT